MGRRVAARPRGSRRGPGKPARSAGRRSLGLRLGVLGGVLALAGLAVLGFALWRSGAAPFPARPEADHLSAQQAEAVGSRLSADGRHVASLPYYRRIVEEFGTEWMAHANYSSALHNAAQESRMHLGSLGPAVRSSVERMALMAVSQREQELAERHARQPADRALAVFQGGQTLQTWGFPLEALAEYRRALEQAPGDPNLVRVATSLTELLAHGGVEGERR